jgi:hypothetical protein
VTRPKPRLSCGGLFTPDPDLPPAQNGQQVCRCGLVGKAGDTHHTLPPAVDDMRSRAAGERSD